MQEQDRHHKTVRQFERLNTALKSGRLDPVRRIIEALSDSELADLLESLPPERRLVVWNLIDPALDGEVLVHLADEVRISLIEATDDDELLEATSDMELDELADIIDDLPDQVIRRLLEVMDREDRERLEQVMSYPEDSAGGLMNPDVVTVRADVTLDVVLRFLRSRGELPQFLDHLFVVDRNGIYLGRLAITNLLTEDPQKMVRSLIDREAQALPVDMEATDVAAAFEHQDWVSAPVVDHKGHLLGTITIDDIVDVIRDEAEQSVMNMAGLDQEEDMFAPVLTAGKRRSVYLGLNLLTALIASYFISIFGATIEQVVALAILMPAVASMGGIAGTQTLTLIVRGMAVGQVVRGNTRPLFSKEMAVGLLNGMLWAAVIAIVAIVWFQDTRLAGVVAAAIFLNMLAGAAAGVAVPLVLRRLSIDPALAGGTVLTTVTDVVGFVSILGLGSLVLL
ncbi:MAG: magnesium transporter [Xanthomonadales bacterium]|nr:magnesium transporter [Xanthomonadales bacterium]